MKKESRGSIDAGTIGETCSDFFDSREWNGKPRPSVVVREAVSDGRRLDEPRLRDAVGQLARAVFVLHRRGLLHLDIKPSNVLVGPGGRVVLLDFGLVRPSAASASESRMTLGTPAYMAPEQAAGERVGTPADWYAVGVVLYRALTGQLPFVGNAADVMVTKQIYAPPDPATLDSELPADLCALTCELRVDPGERPSGRRCPTTRRLDSRACLATDGRRCSSDACRRSRCSRTPSSWRTRAPRLSARSAAAPASGRRRSWSGAAWTWRRAPVDGRRDLRAGGGPLRLV